MKPLPSSLAVLIAFSWAYWVAATAVVLRRFRRARTAAPPDDEPLPPVSILKPVHGADPGALRSFETFCTQAYPEYEVVFGVADPADPAIRIIERVRARHPERRIRLLVDPPRPAGANAKACLLEALARAADHAVLVAADADMRVGPDYLRRVVGELRRPGVALVTCPYRAEDARSPWARLEALHMGVTFLPSAVLAEGLGVPFAMGSTIALRRADLEELGGFAAVKDHLADDFQLGALVAAHGGHVALCPYVPRTVLGRTSLRQGWDREVRWNRCSWVSHPLGSLGYAVTFSVPLALVLLDVTRSAVGLVALAGSLLVRLAAGAVIALRTGNRAVLRDLPLLPLRDLLSAAVWLAGGLGRRVVWRGQSFVVDRHGRLLPARPAVTSSPAA